MAQNGAQAAAVAAKPVNQWSNEQRLEAVINRSAKQLPGEVGDILLGFIEPASLATMVGVFTLWTGAHFFGVGEIADIVLLIVGVVALGGVALEAGENLYEAAKLTLHGRSDADLNKAADCLTKAISLAGVQAVLMVLFRMKPGDTFKTKFSRLRVPPYSKAFTPEFGGPPPRTPGAIFYKPKLKFVRSRLVPRQGRLVKQPYYASQGGTNTYGDITVGRQFAGSAAEAKEKLHLALHHEQVHRFLTPRLQVFREMRMYLKLSGYQKSYILRYLEEALAETYSQLRVRGLAKEYILEGIKFPLKNPYEIEIARLGSEVRGILLGPISVGGMVYGVYRGIQTENYAFP